MAGLEALTSIVYHERQTPGSMLCAQHALNSLLQGSYFSAPDLANIAQTIDSLERESLNQDEQDPTTSANMDDTGFFSVQVMDNALAVWGFNLVRWRSEEMRPYQNNPYTQLAFILNLEQHWFTLRRFGPAVADIDKDAGEGHWYNLNSTLRSPDWISRTYLGMFLQQAEDEGYSVFTIRQANPKAPLALPRTDADMIAATLDARDSDRLQAPTLGSLLPFSKRQGTMDDSSVYVHGRGSGRSTPINDVDYIAPDEDEDWELQAALQASLSSEQPGEVGGPPYIPGDPPVASSSSLNTSDPAHSEIVDPMVASLARNRNMLEAMRRQQEAALRGSYEEEMARFRVQPSLPSPTGQEADDLSEPTMPSMLTREHPRVYDDEDEELQAALIASMATLPEGFMLPESPHLLQFNKGKSVVRPPVMEEVEATASSSAPSQIKDKVDEDDYERLSSPSPITQPVDKDEMRKMRLAKFGG